jgi:hypothetical protein
VDLISGLDVSDKRIISCPGPGFELRTVQAVAPVSIPTTPLVYVNETHSSDVHVVSQYSEWERENKTDE